MKGDSILNGHNGEWLLGIGLFFLAVTVFIGGLFLGCSLNDQDVVRQWFPMTGPEQSLYYLIGFATLIAGLGTGLFLFLTHRLRHKLFLAESKATDLTVLDELTGLLNRRHFYERLEEELDRCRRYGTMLSLIMVDIDDFRKVNDKLGHPLGDVALAEVARLLKANIRSSDIIARYGGEEFAILIPSQGKHAAIHVAEKLRNVVEVNDLTLEGPELKVTISAGVADYDDLPEDCTDNKAMLVRLADHALIKAKNLGRNRVVAHQHTSDRQFKLF